MNWFSCAIVFLVIVLALLAVLHIRKRGACGGCCQECAQKDHCGHKCR